MARFYGWTDDYIGGLEMDVANTYLLAITHLESVELLNLSKIISLPHYQKASDQKKLISELISIGESTIEQDGKIDKTPIMTSRDLAKFLGGSQ